MDSLTGSFMQLGHQYKAQMAQEARGHLGRRLREVFAAPSRSLSHTHILASAVLRCRQQTLRRVRQKLHITVTPPEAGSLFESSTRLSRFTATPVQYKGSLQKNRVRRHATPCRDFGQLTSEEKPA